MNHVAKKNRRSHVIRVSVTTAERAKLRGIARVQGLSMAMVVRALLKGVDDAGKRLEVL